MDLINYIAEEFSKMRDGVENRLDSIDTKQSEMNADLKDHMRRTKLNEERIKHVEEVLKPITKHVNGVQYVGMIIGVSTGVVITIGSLVYAIARIKGVMP